MATKKGTKGPDSFTGTDKNDVYEGLGGQDTIAGIAGNDKLKGGSGNDGILGGAGNDKIWGDAGYDVISGDAGKDILTGGSETDSFIFRTGSKFGVGSEVDIITDVDTNGNDIDHIQIMSLDFTNVIDSYADVLKHADQDGRDVRLDFGYGDVLILENTKKAALSAELFMYEG